MWWSVSISQSQWNITLLRFPVGRRQTSWLFYKSGRYIYTRNLLSFTSFLIAGSVMLTALVIVLSSCCLHKLRFVRGDHCFSIHFCWKGSTSKSTSVSTEDFLAQRGTSSQTGEIFILFHFLSFIQSKPMVFSMAAFVTLCRTIGSLTEWSSLKTSRPNSLSRVANVLA